MKNSAVKKSSQSHSPKVPTTVTSGTLPVEFLSPYHVHDSSHPYFGKSKPWALLPWWALMLRMSPLFLVCLTDHFWVLFASFPFAIQILQKTLQQPHGTDPGTTPLFVCCTGFWTKRLQVHMSKPKILAFITDFFFFFNFSRALGCLKPTFLMKVMWWRCVSVPGESKFQVFLKPLPGWILLLSPQNYPPSVTLNRLFKGMCQ